MEVLQLDMSGRPQSWISAKEAAVIYASDGVAWTLGEAFHVLRGGTQRLGPLMAGASATLDSCFEAFTVIAGDGKDRKSDM